MKKTVFKIIVIILCLTITIGFSGATVYSAAASPTTTVPFSSLSKEEQDIFLKATERLLNDIFNRSDLPVITYTDDLGNTYTGTKDEIMQQIADKANSDYVSAIKDSDGTTLNYIMTNPDTSLSSVFIEGICGSASFKKGALVLSSSAYENALKNTLNSIYGSKTPWQMGIEIANGKPQNVIEIKEDLYISVFDYLGLKYTSFPSLYDLQYNSLTLADDKNSASPTYYRLPDLYYTPYFITSDNKLYLFQANVYTQFRSSMVYNYFYFEFLNNGSSTSSYSMGYQAKSNGHFSFRFVENNGHLYFCCYNSNFNDSNVNNTFYRSQYTISRPQISTAPILFDDYRGQLNVSSSAKIDTTFTNNEMKDGFDISFVNAVDHSDVLTDSEILSANILVAGYFQGTQNEVGVNSSNNLISAGQMLSGTENAISGGDKTINTELSDWQKALYVLAQQQGTTYEELLSKMDMIIDSNGTVSVVGIDGIQHSVSELALSFDAIIGSVEDISKEMSELLEYLKSLNIEGLDQYIQSIEGTLNDLNERDKDNSAVLGDCLGTLQDLKEAMDGLSSDVSIITNTITKVQAVEIDISESINKLDPPNSITTKFPFSLPFDVYNIFNVLSAEPVTPKFTIPFDFSAFGGEVYEINIDLSDFDYIANIVRWLLYGVFLIGLAILTNRLIGRG